MRHDRLLASLVTVLLSAALGGQAAAASNPASAVITVPCGLMDATNPSDRVKCKDLKSNGNDTNSLEFYSGGVLVYTENDPIMFLGKGAGDAGLVSVLLTGNGTHFNGWYLDPTTSILTAPDVTVKIWSHGGSVKHPSSQVVLFQPYSPVGSALWAVHSEDAAQAAAKVDAEIVRAQAAESALAAQLALEQGARSAADVALSTSVAAEMARAEAAEQKLAGDVNAGAAGEVAARKAADAALQAALDAETQARMAGDAALAQNLTAETAARTAGDAALMAQLNMEIAARMGGDATEAMARQMGDTSLMAAITAEAAARVAGDAASIAFFNAHAPWPQSCPAGQSMISTGPNTWTCASGLPSCPANQILVSNGNNGYNCRALCAGVPTDPQSDVKNCGACGTVCLNNNAMASCNAGTCALQCNANFSDCDNNAATGCEANTTSDPKNCSACGMACAGGANASPGCANSKCTLTCNANFGNCDNNPNNGCELPTGADNNNCGACGKACAGNQNCAGGLCLQCGATANSARLSCLDLQQNCQGLGNGVYWIQPPNVGQAYQVYCDMTLDGGGWTTFFGGTNGSPNLFAHFEDVAVMCNDPLKSCLRRLPASVTIGNQFAATCGSAGVKFTINAQTLNYWQNGVQGGGWMVTGNQAGIAGSPNLAYTINTWTGSGVNKGWIIADQVGNGRIFSSSYNVNNVWDYCNGMPDTTSAIRLMYR